MIGLTYSVSPSTPTRSTPSARRRWARAPTSTASTSRTPAASSTPSACASSRRCSSTASRRGPVELHSHGTIGLPAADVHGGRAARLRHAPHGGRRRSPNGTSNPSAETTLRNLEATGFAHALDVEALAAVSEHFRALALDKRLPLGAPGRVRRRLLPPPDAGRHGHDDAPPARGDAPPGAVRGRARGVAAACAPSSAGRSWSRRSRSSSARRR